MKTGLSAIVAGLMIAGLAVTTATSPAEAQNRVDAKKDWSVFEAGSGGQKVCWIVSQPLESAATRGGKKVEVNRGDIFLMVAVRPGDNVKSEVSFLSGYPFKGGSKVTVSVGSKNFTMFTEGENAWTRSPNEDSQLTGAFRRGSKARVEGQSQRGTTTKDTFSLSGFTAAMKVAQSRCS
ncbi:MAG: invasion associated locus B family protein [Paracoccaceae bacterium]